MKIEVRLSHVTNLFHLCFDEVCVSHFDTAQEAEPFRKGFQFLLDEGKEEDLKQLQDFCQKTPARLDDGALKVFIKAVVAKALYGNPITIELVDGKSLSIGCEVPEDDFVITSPYREFDHDFNNAIDAICNGGLVMEGCNPRRYNKLMFTVYSSMNYGYWKEWAGAQDLDADWLYISRKAYKLIFKPSDSDSPEDRQKLYDWLKKYNVKLEDIKSDTEEEYTQFGQNCPILGLTMGFEDHEEETSLIEIPGSKIANKVYPHLAESK